MDLVTWLETAISRLENTARAAAGPKAAFGVWDVDPWHDGTGERADLRARFLGGLTNRGGMELPIAEHTALNDPDTVLRRCQADRETLEQLAAIIGGDYIDDGELPLAEWMLERLAARHGYVPGQGGEVP